MDERMGFESLIDFVGSSADGIHNSADSDSEKSDCSIRNPDGRPNTLDTEDRILHSRSSNADETILSVFWKRGKLGAAYYTCDDSQLHLLNDVVDVRPDFNNLRSLISQAQVSQIVTCGGLPDFFMQTLSECINSTEVDGSSSNAADRIQMSNKIHILSGKNKDLSYDSCKRQVLGMRLGFEPESLNEEDHVLFVNSHIDLKAESMIISLGILVKHLEIYLPQSYLTQEIPSIMFIRHIFLDNLVSIDETTYKALQIFNIRHHPSAFKRNASGCNKEGLSVFGIFNRCKSSVGSKRMREIFTSPSKNIYDLNARLDAVEFCCKAQHQHIVSNMTDCVKNIESITGVLARIYRTRAKVSHWKALYSTLYNAILLGQICQTHSTHSQLFLKIANSITDNIHEMAHYINRVIDFEESSLKNQFTVQVGIDKQLDMMRQTYYQVPDVLMKVAELELEDLPGFIDQCSIVYITELGYLLSVPAWKGEETGIDTYHLPNFEVKFLVNRFVHYKTPRCSELDNVLGDIVAIMSGIESKIMVKLIQFIHARVEDIVEAIEHIAELDCIIALASVAKENNYHRPTLVKERELRIVKGRHLLQELCVNSFVPNDTTFSLESGLVKVLTGPNASGKSVYLKQVALIAYLAHIGSFVPAQSAVIGILDHIHSRIQTVETISTRMSAFLLDLKQISHSLYNSTPSSLLVIDEFGKGTTEIDGLSLLAASLISFIERGGNCPYVLVSTHFHNLPRLLPVSPLFQFQFMNHIVEKDEIVYLHQISNGTSGSSLTHLAAKTAGLAEEGVRRGLDILEGKEICKSNPNLNITSKMMKEIIYMKKLLSLEKDGSAQEINYMKSKNNT